MDKRVQRLKKRKKNGKFVPVIEQKKRVILLKSNSKITEKQKVDTALNLKANNI